MFIPSARSESLCVCPCLLELRKSVIQQQKQHDKQKCYITNIRLVSKVSNQLTTAHKHLLQPVAAERPSTSTGFSFEKSKIASDFVLEVRIITL